MKEIQINKIVGVLTVKDVSDPLACNLYTMPYWKIKNLKLKIVSKILPRSVRICACNRDKYYWVYLQDQRNIHTCTKQLASKQCCVAWDVKVIMNLCACCNACLYWMIKRSGCTKTLPCTKKSLNLTTYHWLIKKHDSAMVIAKLVGQRGTNTSQNSDYFISADARHDYRVLVCSNKWEH